MATTACTLCGRVFARRHMEPVTEAGWYPDGWVFFLGSNRPKLQPYCPTCLPAARVSKDANASPVGGPAFLYLPEAGGSIRAVRFERVPGEPLSATWRATEDVITTPEAVLRAMAVPEGPGQREAAWAELVA